MKIGVIPESLVERIALWIGLVPVPLLETHLAATLARAITAGVSLGVFECLKDGPKTNLEIADVCTVDDAAAATLVGALTACGYLSLSEGRYGLAPQSRRWLLRDGSSSVRDKILLQAFEWDWLAGLESFVRTGRPMDFHTAMSDTERDLYHRSMRALAGVGGWEVGRRTPMPKRARLMLDLGGSHGHFAARICRRHPGLEAHVLDLPEAIEKAAPLLAAEGMGRRVIHVPGNAVEADLGTERYDLVLMSNLAQSSGLAGEQGAGVEGRAGASPRRGVRDPGAGAPRAAGSGRPDRNLARSLFRASEPPERPDLDRARDGRMARGRRLASGASDPTAHGPRMGAAGGASLRPGLRAALSSPRRAARSLPPLGSAPCRDRAGSSGTPPGPTPRRRCGCVPTLASP